MGPKLIETPLRDTTMSREAGEWCSSPVEQHMVGLSKKPVHDSIEVDTAVDPGEVCTEFVHYPRGAVCHMLHFFMLS